MRNLLFIFGFVTSVLFVQAQKTLQLDYLVKIDQEKGEFSGNPDSRSHALLQRDVIGYYGLYNKYDTELKRKVFLESAEGKKMKEAVEIKRKELLEKQYYIMMPDESIKAYDLSTKSFRMEYKVRTWQHVKIPNYINFNSVLLTGLPVPLKNKQLDTWISLADNSNIYYEIDLPVANETLALEIEKNNCALVIVFTIQKGERLQPVFFSEDFIFGKISSVYLINRETMKVYKKWGGTIKQMAKYELSEKEVQRQILAEKAAEKQKLMERQAAEEQKRQEKRKREEEVRRLLTTTNDQDIKTKIDSICNSKLLSELKQWDASIVLYGHYPAQSEIEIETKFWIRMDSLHSEIVKIDDNIIDNHYSWLSDHIKTPYCTVDNENYYKHNNDIFYRKQITIEGKFEKEIYGVKNQNGRFKFYKTTPDTVQKWCQKNITTNGFHAVEYVHYNDSQSIIKLITVDKTTKKLLQGKNPERAKKVWGSIGGAAILLSCLLLI